MAVSRLPRGPDDDVGRLQKGECMDVTLMGQRSSVHDRAVQQQRRRQAEQALVCPTCGYRNRPGAIEIDIDECDDARCGRCDAVWQVRIDHAGVDPCHE